MPINNNLLAFVLENQVVQASEFVPHLNAVLLCHHSDVASGL